MNKVNDEGNGQGAVEAVAETITDEEFEEAIHQVTNIKQASYDTLSTQQKIGVLTTLITAVGSRDNPFLQALLTAAFDDKREAMACADAISERLRYGVDILPITTRIYAQCGIKSVRIDRVLEAMTHQYFHTNYSNYKKNKQAEIS